MMKAAQAVWLLDHRRHFRALSTQASTKKLSTIKKRRYFCYQHIRLSRRILLRLFALGDGIVRWDRLESVQRSALGDNRLRSNELSALGGGRFASILRGDRLRFRTVRYSSLIESFRLESARLLPHTAGLHGIRCSILSQRTQPTIHPISTQEDRHGMNEFVVRHYEIVSPLPITSHLNEWQIYYYQWVE